jgi:hypothetical protein
MQIQCWGATLTQMTDRVRLIRHEAVPGCGSFEVRFADGRVSQYFYFEELPGRGHLTQARLPFED